MLFLIQIKAVLLALSLLIFVLLPACLIAAPFSLDRRLKIICPVWSFCSDIILRYACHARVDVNEDHRSNEFKGIPAFGLYAANHQSYMDIPLIITKFQVPPIMKKEILYIPIFGWLAWVSGALPVSRSHGHSRRKVFSQTRKRVLEDRIGIQVYPEGTRSKTAVPKEYNEIKKTLLNFAFEEKIPVIPTSIYGTRGILTKYGTIKPFRHVGIIVHKEIDPRLFESPEAFSKACWNKVIEGHDQMRDQLAPLNGN